MTHHLKMCNWNFHIDMMIFLHCTGFLENKKYCLKELSLNIKNVLFLSLKPCISYFELQYLESYANFHYVNGEGVQMSNTLYRFNKVQ